uniref:Neurotensin/neuromedin N n=1 Tax=Oryzias latipes TaxID=8090 RepID=A0A3P9KFW0_ORYLA
FPSMMQLQVACMLLLYFSGAGSHHLGDAYACLCPPQLLYDSLEDDSDVPLKRKSPYILKRQAGPKAKSRRPYILKRRTVY